MRTVRTVSELRTALSYARERGARVGLVPTMGALHDGHLSLMSRAREECDEVVVSLFVNPTQFNQASDLDAYPRDERRDAVLAAEQGVDILFAPDPAEVYPPGFATTVSVGGVSDVLEGAHRGRAHFDGVATVVCKLLNMVRPEAAFFGHKDYQQTLVIRRFVTDLDIATRIEVCPTLREPDGLAMSSRNVRLSAEERTRATALYRALVATEESVRRGERDPGVLTAQATEILLRDGIEPEYFALADPSTLAPVERVEGRVLALVAGHLGAVRLIDNHTVSTASAPEPRVLKAAGTITTRRGA